MAGRFSQPLTPALAHRGYTPPRQSAHLSSCLCTRSHHVSSASRAAARARCAAKAASCATSAAASAAATALTAAAAAARASACSTSASAAACPCAGPPTPSIAVTSPPRPVCLLGAGSSFAPFPPMGARTLDARTLDAQKNLRLGA